MRELLIISGLAAVFAMNARADLPSNLDELGIYSSIESQTLSAEFRDYSVNLPLWSDGLEKNRFLRLPENRSAVFTSDERIELPLGSVLVKEFRRDDASRELLETRVMKKEEAGWIAAAYVWSGSGSKRMATRADSATELSWMENGRVRKWTVPGRDQCASCHRLDSSESLSFSTAQVFGAAGNPLSDWIREGILTGLTTPPEAVLNTYPGLLDPHANDEQKSRAILEVNCAGCHSPSGDAPGGIDLRRGTPLMDAGLAYVMPSFGELGLEQPYRIAPGSRESSVLWERMRRTDENRMPAIGSHLPDETAIEIIGRWIDSL